MYFVLGSDCFGLNPFARLTTLKYRSLEPWLLWSLYRKFILKNGEQLSSSFRFDVSKYIAVDVEQATGYQLGQ